MKVCATRCTCVLKAMKRLALAETSQKVVRSIQGRSRFPLINDIERVQNELGRSFPWFSDLDEARRDAMIDIAFNLGLTRLRSFVNALEAMAHGQYEIAANEFMDSRWSQQVGNRAVEVTEMIRTGEYQ